MKVALYARVSQDDLHCENQRAGLEAWKEHNTAAGDLVEYYQEEETTRKTRAIKERILADFRMGKFDTIVIVQVGRWARSMLELVVDVEAVINQGGRFVSIKDGFDFKKDRYNAAAQLQLSIFGAFAQFEREIIRERTLDGLARAKAWGKIGGRHPVGCGCGKVAKDGTVHNGPVKPIRDAHNRMVGWEGLPKQTGGKNPPSSSVVEGGSNHTGV